MGEKMAEQFCRWDPELKIIGLRFSNVMEPQDYARFPGFDNDPRSRHCNLWTYIDARDAAQAIRLALEAKLNGAACLRHRQRQLGDEPGERRRCSTRSIPKTKRKRAVRAEQVADLDRQGARRARLQAEYSLAEADRGRAKRRSAQLARVNPATVPIRVAADRPARAVAADLELVRL